MFSKGRTAMLFSVGAAPTSRWLNKSAERPAKKNQAINAAAKHKPAPSNQRIACLLGFLVDGFAVPSALTDRSSSAVNRNLEAIAPRTFVSAFCKWAGV